MTVPKRERPLPKKDELNKRLLKGLTENLTVLMLICLSLLNSNNLKKNKKKGEKKALDYLELALMYSKRLKSITWCPSSFHLRPHFVLAFAVPLVNIIRKANVVHVKCE